MTKSNDDIYSIYFANYAGKLEAHLLRHGVACSDADLIIEESSILYFENLNSKRMFRIKKQDPSDIFIKSAFQVLKTHIPEAIHTFGASQEISKCIK